MFEKFVDQEIVIKKTAACIFKHTPVCFGSIFVTSRPVDGCHFFALLKCDNIQF